MAQMAAFGVKGPLLITLGYLLRVLSGLSLPLAAIWSAELGADLWSRDALSSAEGLQRGLGRDPVAALFTARGPWWRWLLFRLSHPPNSLRAAILARRGVWGLTLALLLFPAGCLAKLLALQLYAGLTYLSLGYAPSEIWLRAAGNGRTYLSGLPLPFVAMAALTLAWPYLVPYWERAFGQHHLPTVCAHVRAYLFCAGVLALVALAAYPGR